MYPHIAILEQLAFRELHNEDMGWRGPYQHAPVTIFVQAQFFESAAGVKMSLLLLR